MPKTSYRRLHLRGALAAATMIPLAACAGDETLTAYGAAGKTWVLSQIDGKPFAATATLEFPAPGQIAGQAPCNAYRAEITAPYPWFEAGSLAATRAVCPDLLGETRYLEALQSMSEAEVAGDVLILRNDAGRELVFTASG
ncbi:META domain-containing protein [Phycobacter azelaicus]|uniref:META domain-containing protein n=1 Tax=Phycobacter azelaicus TaxID=2668075 RepID=UPI00186631BD|nr:META domain-containing protein [Phycobacter azelaicus]MBE1295183.1 META domain-containing protein [Paracoccaceae bacterium]